MGKTIPIVPISRYLVNNKNALVFTTLVVRFESGNPVGQPYFRHKSVICLVYILGWNIQVCLSFLFDIFGFIGLVFEKCIAFIVLILRLDYSEVSLILDQSFLTNFWYLTRLGKVKHWWWEKRGQVFVGGFETSR